MSVQEEKEEKQSACAVAKTQALPTQREIVYDDHWTSSCSFFFFSPHVLLIFSLLLPHYLNRRLQLQNIKHGRHVLHGLSNFTIDSSQEIQGQ